MQEISSSNPPVVTGICDPNKSRARHHHSLKLGSKLKYLKIAVLKHSQDSQETISDGVVLLLRLKNISQRKFSSEIFSDFPEQLL